MFAAAVAGGVPPCPPLLSRRRPRPQAAVAVGARCLPAGVVWGGVAVVVRRCRKRRRRAPFLSAFGGVAAAASPAACWLGGWGRRRPFPAPRGRCGAGGARLAALLLLCGVPVSFGPGDVAQMAFRLAPAQVGVGERGAGVPPPPLTPSPR